MVYLAVHDCRRNFVCEAGGRGGVEGGGGGFVKLRLLDLDSAGIRWVVSRDAGDARRWSWRVQLAGKTGVYVGWEKKGGRNWRLRLG